MVVIAVSDILDAIGRGARLATAAQSAQASRDLFRALAAGRSERGNLNSFLQASTAVGPDFDARVLKPRKEGQAAYSGALAELEGAGIEGLETALTSLRTAESAVAELRPQADIAASRAMADRTVSVVAAWPTATQRYLDALGAVSDIVDAATAMSDPVIAHYLSIKRAAWAARLGNGGYGFRIGGALAAKR